MDEQDLKSAREIRDRLEEKARAYAARDVDRVMDLYENSNTVSVFDPGPPDEYRGYTTLSPKPSAISSSAPRQWN